MTTQATHSQPAHPDPVGVTLAVPPSALPVEVELAAALIQREVEPTQMIAVLGSLQCTSGFETFSLEGPLLVLSFAHSPMLTLPRLLSADKDA